MLVGARLLLVIMLVLLLGLAVLIVYCALIEASRCDDMEMRYWRDAELNNGYGEHDRENGEHVKPQGEHVSEEEKC